MIPLDSFLEILRAVEEHNLDSLAAEKFAVRRHNRILPSSRQTGRVEYEGESDEELRYRILFSISPTYDMDLVADAYGITRDRGESNEELRYRIRNYLRYGTAPPPSESSDPSRWTLVGDEEDLA